MGLVQPVVWNKRTGNIVGGHQRIAQIDSMEGHANYSLTVAVVDVDETREKELNILLNNQDVGGDWNLDKLKELLTDPVLDRLNTGFDDAEIFKLFGKADGQPDSEHQKAIADQLKGVKDAYAKLTAAGCSKDDMDFYGVVIFGSYNQRKEFLDALGLEDNRYIDGRLLLQIVRGEKAESAAQGNEGDGAGVGEDEAVVALKPA